MSAHVDRIRLRGSTGDVELLAGDVNDDARLTFINTPVTIQVVANDQDVDADPLSVTHFWWMFSDAGGGTLAVADATGNNRVPTITGGTFATGPVVPGV